MSSDGRKSPLFIWALELKAELIPPVSVDDMFFRMLAEDNIEVIRYYHGIFVPRNPVERQRLQDRIETLRYVATQVVVN